MWNNEKYSLLAFILLPFLIQNSYRAERVLVESISAIHKINDVGVGHCSCSD